MTDIRTATLHMTTATVLPTTPIHIDGNGRLLKKILAIRPVLADRERAAAAPANAKAAPAL